MPTVDEAKRQAQSNWIRTRRFTVTYILEAQNRAITMACATPFTIPVVGASIEVSHDGERIVGTVKKLEFNAASFPDGTDFSLQEGMFVHIS